MNSNQLISPDVIAALIGSFIFFIWLRKTTIKLHKEKKSKEWRRYCQQRKKDIPDITWMIDGHPIDHYLPSFYAGILELRKDREITIERIKMAAKYKLLVLKDDGFDEPRYGALIIAARNFLCERLEYCGPGN